MVAEPFLSSIENSCVVEVDLDSLPRNWKTEPAPRRLQATGDEWLTSGASVALRVPSAIFVGEFNYLLNPPHPDFARIEIHGPEKFPIDEWLVKR